ncbi:MAG: MraY family glycosyltransferase [Steroidobacteraceae bacterium]
MQIAAALILAFGLTLASVPLLTLLALRAGLVDLPGPRKAHHVPVPRIGGIAIVFSVIVTTLLLTEESHFLLAYLAGSSILLIFGLWDDLRGANYLVKLVGQLLAATVVMTGGGLLIGSVTHIERMTLPGLIAYPLTMIFIVGATNAMNMSDGLDGLAGGLGLVIVSAIGLLGFFADTPFVVLASCALLGALAGFLRFNTHPAKIFMGDCGSQFLGFSVAVFSIVATQSPSPFSAALPLLILGWPIIDTIWVISLRLARGQSPFAADREHLHHRLIRAGLTQTQAVAAIYACQAAMFLLVYLLRFESDLAIVGTFAILAIACTATLEQRLRVARPTRAANPSEPGPPGNDAIYSGKRYLLRGALIVLVAGYILTTTTAPRSLPTDFRVLALIVLVCALLTPALSKWSPVLPSMRISAYLLTALTIYIDQLGFGRYSPTSPQMLICFSLMSIATVTAIRLHLSTSFELNALDFLVIFLALVVPSLPGFVALPNTITTGLAKAIVCFYAIELLRHQVPVVLWSSGIAIAAITVLARAF